MRALMNVRPGGPEVLEVRELPDPVPRAGQVLIRVRRAGLNFADIAARVGLYPDAPKFPMVVGYEVSGTVEALGEGVTDLSRGDRVLALTHFGGQAELVAVPAVHVRRIPEAMDFDQAAALPVNGLTAFHMVSWVAPVQPGMTVLIHMAAGGVGLTAIQLCRAVPEVTILGTASPQKHDFLRAQGVHHCVDYRSQDYVAEVRRLTGGRGVDRVFDALGGPDWAKGYSLLKPSGHLVAFGWANMVDGPRRNVLTVAGQFLRQPRYTLMQLMQDNKTVSGVNMGHLWGEMELMRRHLDRLVELVARGQLVTHVDRVFPLAQAAEAHAWVQARKNVGKVLLAMD